MKILQKPYKREWTKQLILIISHRKVYASQLEAEIKTKDRTTIQRQLMILQKEGFVLSNREKLKNKLIFILTKKGFGLLSYFKDIENLQNKYRLLLE